MAAGGRRADRGRDVARVLRREVGREIRTARRGSGVSLRAAGAAVSISASELSRIERGLADGVSVERLCLACAAVGLRFSGRAYLEGEPVRDAGHLRVLARLQGLLPPSVPWSVEVPLAIPGDRRALDAVARLGDRRVGFEVELRLDDVQALERRVALKKRDGHLDVVILVIADTRHNRAVLQAHGVALLAAFPLDSRALHRSLRAGAAPAADGLMLL